MSQRIIAEFTGPEGSGKTKLEVAFSKFCAGYGVQVTLPPDAQRAEFEARPIEELMTEVAAKGTTVLVLEGNAPRR